MDRAVVRSVQVFLTVFLVLAVVTASGRALLADGADHTGLAVANTMIGDLLVLFVALGLIWVLPNRIMRGGLQPIKANLKHAAPRAVPAPGSSADTTNPPAGTVDRANAARVGAGEVTSPSGGGKVNRASTRANLEATIKTRRAKWSMDRMMIVALLPAALILAVGALLYFR
jgi:hypothetical protein